MRNNLIFNSLLNASTYSYMGVFNFDGSSNILIRPGNTSQITGNKTIQWKMWLDQESGYTNFTQVFQLWGTSNTDICVIGLVDDKLLIGLNSTVNYCPTYSVNGFGNKVLECEVKKVASSLTYFKINGVTESSIGSGLFGGNPNSWRVSASTPGFTRGTVWDIKVTDDDTSLVTNEFKGYPRGDTSTAWFNLAAEGTNVQITNPNNAGTRNII